MVSVTRINEFKARRETTDSLRSFLASIMPAIESSKGCRSCQILQNKDEPEHFLLVEVWDSVDAHQDALKHGPHGMFKKVSDILAEPPRGEYYLPG